MKHIQLRVLILMLVYLNLCPDDLPHPPSLGDGFSMLDELIVPGRGDNDSHSISMVASNVNSNAAALALSASNSESKKTIAEIKLATESKFKIGTEWNNDILVKELKEFAHSHHFKLRVSRGREVLCSKAATTHSKKLEKGDHHLTRKGCSQVTSYQLVSMESPME